MGKKKGGVRIKQVGPKMPAMPPGGMMMNPMDAFQIPPEDMVHLPVQPDRTYQVFWPIHETFTMKIDDFQTIYPSYIDSCKTTKMGRRIPGEVAVPTPTVVDMSHALQTLQIRHVIQPYKGYSRDITCQWDNPGRIKVDIVRSNYESKKQLLLEMVKIIPHIPDRVARIEKDAAEKAVKELEDEVKKREQESAAAIAAAAMQSKKVITTGSSGGGGGSTKKGKKGNKKK